MSPTGAFNVTGLTWEIKTDDGGVNDKDNTYTWANAQSVFIATLNQQYFGGFSDWRLSAVKELEGQNAACSLEPQGKAMASLLP